MTPPPPMLITGNFKWYYQFSVYTNFLFRCCMYICTLIKKRISFFTPLKNNVHSWGLSPTTSCPPHENVTRIEVRRDSKKKKIQKLQPSDRSIDLTTILVSYHSHDKSPQTYRLIDCYLPTLCPKSSELSWYVAQVPTRLARTLTWRSWGRIHFQIHSGY